MYLLLLLVQSILSGNDASPVCHSSLLCSGGIFLVLLFFTFSKLFSKMGVYHLELAFALVTGIPAGCLSVKKCALLSNCTGNNDQTWENGGNQLESIYQFNRLLFFAHLQGTIRNSSWCSLYANFRGTSLKYSNIAKIDP